MMKNLKRWLYTLVLIGAVLGLAGCGNQAAQTPTTDPKVIYTQVAETVQAQITNNAKLTPKPSNTPAPTETQGATATLRPSSTPFGTGTAAVVLTPIKTGTGSTAVSLPTVAPTVAAATVPVTSSGDKMLYVSQSIPDGTVFKADDDFNNTWVVKNSGTTTWNTNYRIRFFGGDRLNAEDDNLWTTVAPGENLTITMKMNAPLASGKYNSIWVLTNPDGRNFGSFTLEIEVR